MIVQTRIIGKMDRGMEGAIYLCQLKDIIVLDCFRQGLLFFHNHEHGVKDEDNGVRLKKFLDGLDLEQSVQLRYYKHYKNITVSFDNQVLPSITYSKREILPFLNKNIHSNPQENHKSKGVKA